MRFFLRDRARGEGGVDPAGHRAQLGGHMNELPESDLTFLRGLVKASRQKPHRVDWVDRDGSERATVLSPAEAVQLNKIAHGLKVSKAEVLRRAAHIPAKPGAGA